MGDGWVGGDPNTFFGRPKGWAAKLFQQIFFVLQLSASLEKFFWLASSLERKKKLDQLLSWTHPIDL